MENPLLRERRHEVDGDLPEASDKQSPLDVSAFPTDSKERERDAKNLRKAQGLEAKEKKNKVFKVEDHFDDCGEDLSSLGPDLLVVGCC